MSDPTLLEPTADKGDWPALINEPEPLEKTGEDIAPEPEPLTESDQVRKPATQRIAEGVLVELEGWEDSPANTLAAVSTSWPLEVTFEELKDLFKEDLTNFFLERLCPVPLYRPLYLQRPLNLENPL